MVKILILVLLLGISTTIQAQQQQWSNFEIMPLKTFLINQAIPEKSWPLLQPIKLSELPKPWNKILSQTLLTPALAHYYQRMPKIKTPLFTLYQRCRKYSRGIVMIVDDNKQRNHALLADRIGENSIIMLGLITINFKILPLVLQHQLLTTQIPFGTLLHNSHIPIANINTKYFKTSCNQIIARYIHCTDKTILYGRTNTLVDVNNKQWLAYTVEILPPVY